MKGFRVSLTSCWWHDHPISSMIIQYHPWSSMSRSDWIIVCVGETCHDDESNVFITTSGGKHSRARSAAVDFEEKWSDQPFPGFGSTGLAIETPAFPMAKRRVQRTVIQNAEICVQRIFSRKWTWLRQSNRMPPLRVLPAALQAELCQHCNKTLCKDHMIRVS